MKKSPAYRWAVSVQKKAHTYSLKGYTYIRLTYLFLALALLFLLIGAADYIEAKKSLLDFIFLPVVMFFVALISFERQGVYELLKEKQATLKD